MRKLIAASMMFALFTTTAFAQSVDVSFSKLTTVVPGADLGPCKARYGTGYITSAHESGVHGQRSSDKGHFIHIVKSSVTLHHDVYVMANEYEIGFPGDKGEVTTNAYVYATSLDKKQGFSGVFSDGQCKGQVTVSPK